MLKKSWHCFACWRIRGETSSWSCNVCDDRRLWNIEKLCLLFSFRLFARLKGKKYSLEKRKKRKTLARIWSICREHERQLVGPAPAAATFLDLSFINNVVQQRQHFSAGGILYSCQYQHCAFDLSFQKEFHQSVWFSAKKRSHPPTSSHCCCSAWHWKNSQKFTASWIPWCHIERRVIRRNSFYSAYLSLVMFFTVHIHFLCLWRKWPWLNEQYCTEKYSSAFFWMCDVLEVHISMWNCWEE